MPIHAATWKARVLGPSAAELAAAVAALPGTSLVSGPTDVTVGGNPAKYVESSPSVMTSAVRPTSSTSGMTLQRAATPPSATDGSRRWGRPRVWIVEVDGQYVWVEAETYKGAGPDIEQEIQQIIDSISFE